jgi:hypothetical protein
VCFEILLQGVPLKRYVIQETTENRVTFYFRSPREGNYYITVFAQQVGVLMTVIMSTDVF